MAYAARIRESHGVTKGNGWSFFNFKFVVECDPIASRGTCILSGSGDGGAGSSYSVQVQILVGVKVSS
jgi:hypothetical protein